MTPPFCINPTETVRGVLESHQRLLGLRSDSGVLGLVELLAESLQSDHLLQTRKMQICGFVVLTCAAVRSEVWEGKEVLIMILRIQGYPWSSLKYYDT